jgi:hypothetical protein
MPYMPFGLQKDVVILPSAYVASFPFLRPRGGKKGHPAVRCSRHGSRGNLAAPEFKFYAAALAQEFQLSSLQFFFPVNTDGNSQSRSSFEK